EAVKIGLYDVIQVAYNYSMFDNKEMLDAVEGAASKGIGIIAMKTQAGQPRSPEYDYGIDKKFYEGSKVHRALLKWAVHNENITCAIPGSANYEQLEENFSVAYDLEYTPEEKEFLEDKGVKMAVKGFCRQCDLCLSTCPKGVDIPTLMRTHMYAVRHISFYEAREALETLPREKSVEKCASCKSCRAQCNTGVDIPKRIGELKAIFV
ncbi:4Fe-4S dicluster domain-containing protein, partial [Acidobacteriota bacterium]